ncbi:hypothetical protein [Polycladidibacter stylochi]|uniref:hypothetical protein n=1 Tax=Polycladidibacter stylochi TaxID=1807766 RepID=UPI00082969D3|nr:hypothetical protein [Pseudovibrio stylochi]
MKLYKKTQNHLKMYLGICVGLLISVAMAHAKDATLLTPTVCQNVNNLTTAKWLQVTADSPDIFYMDEGGTVTNIDKKSTANFDEATFVYVIGHGSVDKLGDWPGAVFGSYLKAAHPSKMDFLYITSCEAANNEEGTKSSLLRSVEKTMADPGMLLMGFKGCSFMTTDGNLDFNKGELTDNGQFLPDQQGIPNENAIISANTGAYWDQIKGTTDKVGNSTLKDYCETALNKADMDALVELMTAFDSVYVNGADSVTYPPHNILRHASFWKAVGKPVTCGGTTPCPDKN